MSDAKLHIQTFVDPSFGENSLVIHTQNSDGKNVGWIVDPGLPPQPTQALAYIAEQDITLETVLLTHGHLDHIAGVDEVCQAHPDAKVLIAKPDEPMLANANLNLSAPFGEPRTITKTADGDLVPDAVLKLGCFDWLILDTAGHSPGGRSFYCAQAEVVIVGDALFANSIGRTDFPGSDSNTLITNLKTHVLNLPGDTVVCSGHGPTTTVEIERKSNPYLTE